MAITATLDKNWRDECFGRYDFEKLEYFLSMAYHICKDIDSTSWFENWPDDIRFYIAQAYATLLEWNRVNLVKDNGPSQENAQEVFKTYREMRDRKTISAMKETFSPMYGCSF